MSLLEKIIRDAKIEFMIAKQDGVLEISEVIQIALNVSKKVYSLSSLSDDEKTALVLLSLKKGLAAAGGLPMFENIPAETKEAVEEQLLKAGLGVVDLMRKNAPLLFAPVKKALLVCFPACSHVLDILDSKDTAVLQDALRLVSPSPPVTTTQVVVVQTDANPPVESVKDTPLPNTPEKESNQEASP